MLNVECERGEDRWSSNDRYTGVEIRVLEVPYSLQRLDDVSILAGAGVSED